MLIFANDGLNEEFNIDEVLSAGDGGKRFHFLPCTNAVLQIVDIQSKHPNDYLSGYEVTLNMQHNKEGVDIGETQDYLLSVNSNEDQKRKYARSDFQRICAAVGVNKPESADQIIGKMFSANIVITPNKNNPSNPYMNLKAFKAVPTAQTVPKPTTQPAQQGFAAPNPQQGFSQPQTGFNQQPAFTQK